MQQIGAIGGIAWIPPRTDPGDVRKQPPKDVRDEWHRLMRRGQPEDVRVGDLFAAFIDSLREDSENRQTTPRQLPAPGSSWRGARGVACPGVWPVRHADRRPDARGPSLL